MTRYMPLLKAKPGEFQAYGLLSGQTVRGALPLFEWCPNGDPAKEVEKPVQDAIRLLPPGSRIAADFSALSPGGVHVGSGLASQVWATRELRSSGIDVIPVAWAGMAPTALAGLAENVRLMSHPEVVVRLRPANIAVTAGRLTGVAAALGLPLRRVHLLLDFGAVLDTSAVAVAASQADGAVRVATSIGPWASITVASGAFPPSISGFPPRVANLITRWDAELWRRVRQLGHNVDFGDYAVNATVMPSPGARGPMPNLRYAAGSEWLVWREPKTPVGNTAFFTVAQRVAAHQSYSGSTYSWGDSEIDRCARAIGGAGTATQWRAYGTSHHLTLVVDRLASLGAP